MKVFIWSFVTEVGHFRAIRQERVCVAIRNMKYDAAQNLLRKVQRRETGFKAVVVVFVGLFTPDLTFKISPITSTSICFYVYM